MIYTVTLNPSLDLIYTTKKDKIEEYILSSKTMRFPGGKGINTTRMLNNLGIPSIATGFLGGNTGQVIKNWFIQNHVDSNFIDIGDENRINTRIRTPKAQYTIEGISPKISDEQLNDLIIYLSKLREGDILVMGGSIPNNCDPDIYIRLTEIARANKADFVIDVDAKSMKRLLSYRPLLIKPNINNLAKMFDVDEINTEVDILKYGKKCIELGAKNAIVSIGKDGSYLFTEDNKVYRAYGVEGKVVNSFNSRDAMIGGFIGVYMRLHEPVEAFRMAAAAASATAFVEDLADKDLTHEIYDKTKVEEILL